MKEILEKELILIQTLLEIVDDKPYPIYACNISSEALLDKAISIAKERI